MAGKPEAVLHGAHRYKTIFLVSLDVETTFDVDGPGVIARILVESGEHGWINATLLEEMENFKGEASFESCETDVKGR